MTVAHGSASVAVALALIAAAAPGPGSTPLMARAAGTLPGASQRLPAFRAGVDMVSLTVTVTDARGRYQTDLGPADFSVFEDGAAQDILFVSRANVPIALALLLDTSASMEGRMTIAQDAAIGFARRLRPEDLAELIDFDRAVKVVQGFTNNTAALVAAIRKTAAGGSTSLYNAIYISLKELARIRPASEQDIRRQAIVVLSDGEDTSSLVSYEQVLDLAKRSETAVYTIGLRSKDEPEAKGFKEAEFVLRSLAWHTGGRVFFAERAEDLRGVYAQVADELASQYVVGYVSKNARLDGAWRRTVVQVRRDGAIARTRQGYYAPKGK